MPFDFVADIQSSPYPYRGSTSIKLPSDVTILSYNVISLTGYTDNISTTLGSVYAFSHDTIIINVFSNTYQTIRGYLRVLYYE